MYDDGVGFDQADPTRGFGLVGMRERVALAGGVFSITSRPGDGTCVNIEIPVAGGHAAGLPSGG